MSFSAHIDNKKRDILVIENGPMQGLGSILTAEKMYSISFTSSLHHHGANSYLFVNGTEIY